jgi:hypothetical protein
MKTGRRKRSDWLVVGALAGAAYGTALGWADLIYLGRIVDFQQPRNFRDLPSEFVGYLLIGMNSGCGLVTGLIAAFLMPRSGSLLARVLPGSVLGGYLGAMIGVLDLLIFALYLNLLDSDLLAAWRENRALLLILNAAATAVVGAFYSFLMADRTPS